MRRTIGRFNPASRIVAGSEKRGEIPATVIPKQRPPPATFVWAQTAGWPHTFGPVTFLAAFHLQSPSLHGALIHHPARAKQ